MWRREFRSAGNACKALNLRGENLLSWAAQYLFDQMYASQARESTLLVRRIAGTAPAGRVFVQSAVSDQIKNVAGALGSCEHLVSFAHFASRIVFMTRRCLSFSGVAKWHSRNRAVRNTADSVASVKSRARSGKAGNHSSQAAISVVPFRVFSRISQ